MPPTAAKTLVALLLITGCSSGLDRNVVERIAAHQQVNKIALKCLQEEARALETDVARETRWRALVLTIWQCETFTQGGCWE